MGAEARYLTPALKAPTPHEPVTRLAEQARRVVAFHAPPATAFLMRLPGTTSTDFGRPDRTDLRDRDEKGGRGEASSRRIGRALGSPAALARGSFNGYFGAARTITGGTRSRWTGLSPRRGSADP